ncbi:hypothetical protein [Actinokineospora terrae]|uniref:Uncharacterized protein n=1 Tax=Actinokineospora terrae TaxID=155974 RepID=A0A1H9MVY8_9PSEU|nr:hypothetical protein [Actinokineospora terrae]SER27273.1 hypothetical protein SAMN04487818_102339 [Actinokineospora terrae]
MTGIVVAGRGDHWWAWAASRVMPAAAPFAETASAAAPTHNEHAGSAGTVVQVGHVAGGVHLYAGEALAPDHSEWLRSAWAYATGAVMEMRYITRAGRVEGFLLVRAEGAEREEVEQQVIRLRSCLGAMPGHSTAVPVRDKAETCEVLAPFEPRGGVVEIRKRLTAHRTSRDDASSPWLAAVTPFAYRRQPWEPLWSAMAGLPFRAMLSVGLAPFTIGPGLRSHLAARATEFGRLAQVGPPPTGVWSAYRPPDEFAVAALPLVADAVRRYTDQAFLTRVSLAGEQPVPTVLAELAANTISPPEPMPDS